MEAPMTAGAGCARKAGEVPMMVNCTAGKDRTGVAIALLLELAGVPRDAIVEDYMRSAIFGENLVRAGELEPGMMASFGFMPSAAQVDAHHMVKAVCRDVQHIAALPCRNACVRHKAGHIAHSVQQGGWITAQKIMPQIPRCGQNAQGRLHSGRIRFQFRRHHHRKARSRQGLGNAQHPHTVQQAFLETQAAQCGYCLNGMVMMTVALLERHPQPNEDQIKAALSGNLCRCGTHLEIIAAVHRAAALLSPNAANRSA
jgi:hypothetical protein